MLGLGNSLVRDCGPLLSSTQPQRGQNALPSSRQEPSPTAAALAPFINRLERWQLPDELREVLKAVASNNAVLR